MEKLFSRFTCAREQQNDFLLTQERQSQSNLAIAQEKALINVKKAESDLEEHEGWVEITKALANPETIDLDFLKKYGIIFLIFFIGLWYLTKRRK